MTEQFERTRPMALHKGLVIRMLQEHPEDVAEFCPGWPGTAAEAIGALKAAPWDWKVGAEYLTDAEFKARQETAP